MDTSYLHDAFKDLAILDEEVFDISKEGSLKEAEAALEAEPEDVIDIMDMEFEDSDVNVDEEEAEVETHVGDVIFDCPVCHSKLYKHPDEVELDELEEFANTGEECPYCFSTDGFKIVGQVAPYQPEDEVSVEVEDKVIDDNETEKVEDEEDIEVNESLKNNIKESRSLNRKLKKIKESKDVDLTAYQKWVDYDMKKYHKISDNTMNKIKKAGLSVVKDQYGEYEVIADKADSDAEKDKSFRESRKLKEAKWRYELKAGPALRTAIENEDFQGVQKKLQDAYVELFDNGLIDEDDYEEWSEEVSGIDLDEDELDYQLNEFYDLCDNLKIWIPFADTDESLKTTKKVHEGFEKVELETDDQKITVKSEPREEVPGETMIAPVTAEVKDEIDVDSELDDEESEDEVDYDISEFSEEEFDELGESYLKNVYENVESFKTTFVGQKKNSLVLEGLIKFASGNEKKTRFVFESFDADKKGKVRFLGENQQISRGKKSFTLKGSINSGKFIAESLNYNYKAKTPEGKSTRVYGTVKMTEAKKDMPSIEGTAANAIVKWWNSYDPYGKTSKQIADDLSAVIPEKKRNEPKVKKLISNVLASKNYQKAALAIGNFVLAGSKLED